MSKVEVIQGKSRQSFTAEEKQNYVAEFKMSGLSLQKFARKVGISQSTLFKWVKENNATKGVSQMYPHTDSTMAQNELVPVQAGTALQGRVETVLNENMLLQKENQWLKTQVTQYQRTLGRVVFESGRVNFEDELKMN